MWKVECYYYTNTGGPRVCTGSKVIAEYEDYREAERAWRELAWKHVDDASVWHRLTGEKA